jgi:phosphoribosylanthranilate isomerase
VSGAARRAAPGPAAARGGTIVKVCGLTRLDDALAALAAGADWLGFVVAGESPRRIAPERAAEFARALPGATTVAVMVAPTPAEARDLAVRAGATRVQLHRVDAAAWPRDFPWPVAVAVPVAADGAIVDPLPPLDHLVLLDSADETRAGGTGRRVPWETARVVAASRPVLLAGGLDGECVTEALERVRPYGVDASSRLESAPGLKDPGRVRRFVAAVRAWDERSRSADAGRIPPDGGSRA